ncbi:MAG: hypothetical protein WA197_04440 [Candidatus Acidiferrales bacterium]
MSADISTDALANAAAQKPRPRKHFLCSALTVAALANAAVPAIFFSATRLFGPTDPRYRAMVAVVVLIEYAIVFLLLLFHANEPFASGYAVSTAAIVTIGSAAFTYMVVAPAGWGWSALYAEIIVLAGMAFAVVSNVVFLLASIKYARAIHPRLHLGGFFLGIAASLALLLLYTRILP